MTDKYQMVSDILHLYDENDRLRSENQHLKVIIDEATTQEVPPSDEDKAMSFARAHIYEAGRKAIVTESLDYFKSVRTKTVNGDTVPETFNDWASHTVEKIPSWMSRDTFMKLFDDVLHDVYDSERTKTYNSIHAEENED